MGIMEFLRRPLFSVNATIGQPEDIRIEAAGRSASEEAISPRLLSEFVGQAEAVRLLRVEVEAAKRIGRPLSHVLLYGPPGTGKTSLAHILAAEVGATVHESTGGEFSMQKAVLLAFAEVGKHHEATGKPVVWIIDEADAIPRDAGYALHSILSNGWVPFRGTRYGGVPLSIMMTTNYIAQVPPALRSRFAVAAKLDFYSSDELSRIAEQAAGRMGIRLSGQAAEFIGLNGGGEPRKVTRRILTSLANLLAGRTFADLKDAQEAVDLCGLRPGGLTRDQVEYLQFLDDAKTASVTTIGAYLGEPTRDVESEVEPFLLRSRAVLITARGRTLTETGRGYVAALKGAPG
jgi:Holliday junction DNA helicase RuvB